ncbi:MAG: DUF2993 domain-containing protein [Actinomyces sp.]|jgi:hypothetical protein|nr:DUF2993 domain-containing protein [Actinomyces sp.]MCI1787170.1 DUF2993 domain-containing protein [Actinomyces sp.]MCI1829564.1 DUF2993 domain-containing protein [Actinomyces sp.]MCI1866568.1 DUF2993 domain-containing protein [Actinomyces sp.]
MRTAGRLLAAALALAAVLAGADRLAAHELEAGIARGLASTRGVISGEAAGLGDVEVAVEGFPVLTQLAGGSLEELDVRIPAYAVTSGDVAVTLHDVTAELGDVSTGLPRVAGSVRASGVLTEEELAAAATGAGLPGTVSISPDGISLSGEALGMGASASLALSIGEGGRGLLLTPVSVRLGDRELPMGAAGADALPAVTIPLDALPAGVVLQEVTPSQGRLSVTLTGADVDL